MEQSRPVQTVLFAFRQTELIADQIGERTHSSGIAAFRSISCAQCRDQFHDRVRRDDGIRICLCRTRLV
jgi:hypothetical protein